MGSFAFIATAGAIVVMAVYLSYCVTRDKKCCSSKTKEDNCKEEASSKTSTCVSKPGSSFVYSGVEIYIADSLVDKKFNLEEKIAKWRNLANETMVDVFQKLPPIDSALVSGEKYIEKNITPMIDHVYSTITTSLESSRSKSAANLIGVINSLKDKSPVIVRMKEDDKVFYRAESGHPNLTVAVTIREISTVITSK